jgi:uncharacterized Tic20 family protein
MDNNVDKLGGSGDDQKEPESENTFPPVDPTPEAENVFPPVEPVGQPDTPSFPEPEDQQADQPETPPVPEHDDPYVMPPTQEGISKDERLWATFCHLSVFSSCFIGPIGAIIGPLVVWLIKKDESQYVDMNGKKALNFQISMAIYTIASLPLLCGGPLVLLVIIPLVIVNVIYTIIAAIKANSGEEVSYPISINIIK